MQRVKFDKHCIGKVVEGHVLDCALKPLLRACRDIEPRLYFKWNALKNSGHGMWELRIKPTHKEKIYFTDMNGHKTYILDYVENDFEHHVKDFECLNYSIVQWLREHDTFEKYDWQTEREYESARKKEYIEKKCREEQAYMIRENRKQFKELQEDFLAGRVNWGKILGGLS